MIAPTSLVKFSDFVNSLRVDYNSKDTIPICESEDSWRDWGNIVASSPTFSNRSVPTTEGFSNWREWGIITYSTMVK